LLVGGGGGGAGEKRIYIRVFKKFTIVQNFTPRKEKKEKNWWEFGTGSQKLNMASKKIAGSTKYLSLRPTWLHALIMTSPGHKIFSPKFQKFWGKKTLSI
jgi:hypothetical protein